MKMYNLMYHTKMEADSLRYNFFTVRFPTCCYYDFVSEIYSPKVLNITYIFLYTCTSYCFLYSYCNSYSSSKIEKFTSFVERFRLKLPSRESNSSFGLENDLLKSNDRLISVASFCTNATKAISLVTTSSFQLA